MQELHDIIGELEGTLGPLAGEPLALTGGITNRNYRVELGGVQYVIRLHGRNTQLLGIDREAERLATQAAAALGIAPVLAAARENCLVTRYIACAALSAREVALAVEQIACALRGFHDCGVRLPRGFSVASLLEEYAGLVRARGGELPGDYAHAQRVVALLARTLETAAPQPCHNDLLAANIIRAREAGELLIVDWEYAGMGDARFDLGNLAVNNDFDEETEERMLRAYHRRAATRSERATLKLMRVLSDAREAAWGVVQGVLSDLDFDFAAYAAEHFARLHAAVEQPAFEEWLALAAG